MKQFIVPSNEGHFYLLNPFFNHIHDEVSSSNVYLIPWENGYIIVPKRDPKRAGCVGCVVRRIISTVYHVKGNICAVDAVWTNFSELEKKIPTPMLDESSSSTKCFLYKFDSERPEEIHILPAPACLCSELPQPSLSPDFVELWLQKWPNIVLQKNSNHARPPSVHLYSAKLPNIVPLFTKEKNSIICVPSSPTVTALRDEENLSKRLLGESIERYVLHHVPLDRLYNTPDESLSLSYGTSLDFNKTLWTKVENLDGKMVFLKADLVFSGLHRLYSKDFLPLSSSGTAAHTSIEAAKTNALLELIERNTLLVAWRAVDQINLFQKLPEFLQESRQKKWIEKLAFMQEHELLLCAVRNQFNLPMVLAITLPRSDSCNFAPNFGSAVSFSWENAYSKALSELLQGIAIPDLEKCEEIPSSFNECPRFWAHPKRVQILRKRMTPQHSLEASSRSSSMDELIDQFKKLRIPLYFADLTTSDIALTKWKVFRAICPDFEPFVGNAKYEKPSLQRVNECLKSMKESAINQLNNDPFPFPLICLTKHEQFFAKLMNLLMES